MKKKITIIDFGFGNLASVANALKKLEIPYKISSDPAVVKNADGLILPGDGAAGTAMKNLKKSGLDLAIKQTLENGKPLLGICIGMQIALSYSEENETNCLNMIEGEVKKIKTNFKVPQIGWNTVTIQRSKIKNQKYNSKFKSILDGIPNNSYFYFINSFICSPVDKNIVTGTTDYGEDFCSVFEQKNIFGVQFHPEKSGEPGLQLLRNFWKEVQSC